MKKAILITISAVAIMYGCNNNKIKCNDAACGKPSADGKVLACKLTSEEMQNRKSTVLDKLRKQVIEKKELANGFAFKFKGNDKMIDELVEFAKTERQCCDFFNFNLSISGDTSAVWLEITGPDKAKEFIKTEMEL